MSRTFNNGDLGGYMMRSCGGGWEYCNGRCSTCYKSHLVATNHTPSIKTPLNPNTTTNGTPRYIGNTSGR